MERIKADDLYAYRFLSEVAVAPDGAHAAFVSRRARDDGKGYYACIHLLDTATGAVRPLTGNGDEAAFRWLDSNTLISPLPDRGISLVKPPFTAGHPGKRSRTGFHHSPVGKAVSPPARRKMVRPDPAGP